MTAAAPTIDPATMAALMKDNRAPQLAGVMISGLAVALVVLSLRFWIRTMIVHKVAADDWFALLSFVSRLRFSRDLCLYRDHM